MRILFIHQNFPAQFRHLATALAAEGHEVLALGVTRPSAPLPGVQHLQHQPQPLPPGSGPWTEQDVKLARARSCGQAMAQLRERGLEPDVVFAHPGWGEAWFVRDVFPRARFLAYAEYYYALHGADINFDPEFPSPTGPAQAERARLKNTHLLHVLADCDGALSPTQFQRDRHPAALRSQIRVIHDGIDTDRFVPDAAARFPLGDTGRVLRPGDEVITFVARQLEPMRGYHRFLRALPLLQRLRPQAQVVLVGGQDTSYGARPPAGQTWRDHLLGPVQDTLDMRRIHFTGTLPHAALTQLMQVSAAHVYLTYPFVLSWSLLEAMSIGCLVVGSDTAPVQEVIEHGRNGWLVDFFDHEALAHTLARALAERATLGHLRQAARQTVLDRYDLHRLCLPAQRHWLLQG
jgi:glycosyltransferase involved in cell wall biosynthesis